MKLGWIPFEDIPAVYRSAELFIYPTLHEGFGLPILETIACGTPVICSQIEPLTEATEDAAYFADPYDQSDIARGIARVSDDEALRKKLIYRGLLRAREFTWEKTARTTLNLLNGMD